MCMNMVSFKYGRFNAIGSGILIIDPTVQINAYCVETSYCTSTFIALARTVRYGTVQMRGARDRTVHNNAHNFFGT
jgi:hypothetical protein